MSLLCIARGWTEAGRQVHLHVQQYDAANGGSVGIPGFRRRSLALPSDDLEDWKQVSVLSCLPRGRVQAFQIDRPRRSPNTGILVLPPQTWSRFHRRTAAQLFPIRPLYLGKSETKEFARMRALEAEPLRCFRGEGGRRGEGGEQWERNAPFLFPVLSDFCAFTLKRTTTNELGSLLGALKGIWNNFIGFLRVRFWGWI